MLATAKPFSTRARCTSSRPYTPRRMAAPVVAALKVGDSLPDFTLETDAKTKISSKVYSRSGVTGSHSK